MDTAGFESADWITSSVVPKHRRPGENGESYVPVNRDIGSIDVTTFLTPGSIRWTHAALGDRHYRCGGRRCERYFNATGKRVREYPIARPTRSSEREAAG
jgi:hypothetical protein